MPSYIHHIETTVPKNEYGQEVIREHMKELVAESDLHRRIIHRIYSQSGIEKRHSVLDGSESNTAFKKFFTSDLDTPGTEFRNNIYKNEAGRLFVATARKMVAHPEVDANAITHLITVSCTGFYAPGPDFDIIRGLGLSRETQRFHLGFMGCYAGITALKLASQLCEANSDATVMIVSTELCTLHFQPDSEMDNLISTSVFADGSSGAIVSSRPPDSGPSLEVSGFVSSITDEGEKDMAWTIGDTGFNMVLSTYIPDILSRNMYGFLDPVLQRFDLSEEQISHWAIHPGGRAILDKVEKQLALPDEALSHSRKVLNNYGNMSSATILFVLKEILEGDASVVDGPDDRAGGGGSGGGGFDHNISDGPISAETDSDDIISSDENAAQDDTVLAMAFGPGLTIESGLLKVRS